MLGCISKVNSQIDKVDTGKRGDEHAKRHQDRNENSGRVHEAPWLDDIPNHAHDERSASNVNPLGSQRSKVHAACDRVLHQIDSNLAKEEAKTCKEGPRASWGVVIVIL